MNGADAAFTFSVEKGFEADVRIGSSKEKWIGQEDTVERVVCVCVGKVLVVA
jgi:hypothetical protein